MTGDIPIENREIYQFGPFRADATERLLFGNDEPIHLPGKTFDLLLALLRPAGRLRSRDELIEALWPDTIVEEANLTWNVNALRHALGDDCRTPRYVETVRGHGYRFIAPVEVETPAAPAPAEEIDRGDETENVEASHRRDSRAQTNADGSRAWRAPTGAWFALAATIIIVAGVLVWRFTPLGWAGKDATPVPAIAVLPFENLSTDQANAYFAAGIQDTILSKLAGIGGLRVISRTSTERYPSNPTNLKQIARQLDVTAVIEGSVQKAGDQVLINVQLIDAKNNDHIWAHTYTRQLADVFTIENDIATRVAAALKAKLLPAEAARLATSPTRDPQAYLLFLKANYQANRVLGRGSAKNFATAVKQAAELYHQAIARDPRFALAYARLSL